MTLCLAWKIEDRIYFASDSRISRMLNSDFITISDTAPKIFSIPILIYKSELELLYDKDWGMCLCGGYIAGSGYADTLAEVLSNLQIASNDTKVDYKTIIKIAFDIYEQISRELVETGNKEALAKILITGVCPNNINNEFLYEFGFTIHHLTGVKYYSREIDFNEYAMHLIGDDEAITYFKDNLKRHNTLDYFRLLKEICKNADLKTVGGNLQVGVLQKIHPKYFSIHGMIESKLELNEDSQWFVKNNWLFRSIELSPELIKGEIHVRKIFLSPFEKERLALIEEAKSLNQK